jgi:3-dehydroquinate synthase
VGSRVPNDFRIKSHKGEYAVRFNDDIESVIALSQENDPHFIIDANVARLYAETLRVVLANPRTIVIEATEENKSIERIIEGMRTLVDNKLRRTQSLVAIGGGIIQDITCFIASTMLRGVPWTFLPTTLLAQADSCIGSKSSVNLGSVKNILGTFTPPREINISSRFLDTLPDKDIRSGIGEIIKVHAIDSAASFDELSSRYPALLDDRSVLIEYIDRALKIKKRYIETDEFDQGIRNIFNYGHSFGHAIESATDFAVPHGIAVTMGMKIANSVAAQRGIVPERHRKRMSSVLDMNYRGFESVKIPFDEALSALTKDKKNTASQLVVILPVGDDAVIQKVGVDNDAAFQAQFRTALAELRQ